MAGKSEIVVCQAINFAIAPFVHFRRASAVPGRMRGYRLAYRSRPEPGGTNQVLRRTPRPSAQVYPQPSNIGLLQLKSLVSWEPGTPFCDRSRGRQ